MKGLLTGFEAFSDHIRHSTFGIRHSAIGMRHPRNSANRCHLDSISRNHTVASQAPPAVRFRGSETKNGGARVSRVCHRMSHESVRREGRRFWFFFRPVTRDGPRFRSRRGTTSNATCRSAWGREREGGFLSGIPLMGRESQSACHVFIQYGG